MSIIYRLINKKRVEGSTLETQRYIIKDTISTGTRNRFQVQRENRTCGAQIPFFVTPRRSFRFGFPRKVYLHSTFLSVILLDLKDAQSFFETANGCTRVRRRVDAADRSFRSDCLSVSRRVPRDSIRVHHVFLLRLRKLR